MYQLRSYLYRCPICKREQNYSTDKVNERCYCHYCENDGKAVLMEKIKENDAIQTQLLLEDDLK